MTNLAVNKNLLASSRYHALNAIVFLYKEVRGAGRMMGSANGA
jgi:hypothetical protein